MGLTWYAITPFPEKRIQDRPNSHTIEDGNLGRKDKERDFIVRQELHHLKEEIEMDSKQEKGGFDYKF